MASNTQREQSDCRVGEVIEASTSEFTTQCYRLYDAPALGSLVRCGERTPTYGIVCEATTQSLDPARHTIPRGVNEATEDGIFSSNPQIERLLYTRFRAIIVGHHDGSVARRYLPPTVPRIYAFVGECDAAEMRDFSNSLEFVPLLLAAPISAQDDVIAAFLRQASATHPDAHDFLVAAGKTLATALAGQLPRLSGILGRLQ